MVPSNAMGAPARRNARNRHPYLPSLAIPLCLLATALAWAPPLAAHDGAGCVTDGDVPEYETGEVGEYVTGEIPEYVTGEIPEYVTKEIPEYRPHADGAYIPDSYPPEVKGTHYVEVKPGIFILQRGAGGRAYARFARLIGGFEGDRLVTYLTYGFPSYRHRENDQDRITTHWTYPEENTTFIFCGNTLVGTRYF